MEAKKPLLPKQTRHAKLKAAGICASCARVKPLPGKLYCDDCAIKNIWATTNSQARDKGYAQIALSRADFVAWYKKRRSQVKVCEWNSEPFGKRGPVVNYDHVTGEPRGLICNLCSLAESLGVTRLKKIIGAVEPRGGGKK